jgi:hypothetical protein
VRKLRWATIGWGALFAFLWLLMVVVGLESALHFLGPAIDGPFQLYNSLRRIWVGQRGGVDFQFFHGLAIPYLHYIPFRLLGGGFIASEITRQMVSVVLYPLTVLVFLRFFIRDWTRTLAWAAIVMTASIALRMTSVLVALNSLLGIRSTFPTLMAVALCLPARRAVRNTIAALTLGCSLVFGTEQGLAVLLALIIVTIVVALASRDRRTYLVDGAVVALGGFATLLAVLLVIGGPVGMKAALTYNFRTIPMDQYWYFGSPPNLFLATWSAMPELFRGLPRIPIAVLGGLVIVVLMLYRLWRDADSPNMRRQFALSVVMLYGVISCASLLGTYVNAYIQPLLRVLLLVAAVYLSDLLPARDASLGRRPIAGVGRSTVLTAVAAAFMMIAIVPSMFATIFITMPHMLADHVIRRQGAVYSGIWPTTIPAGQAILDSRRGPRGELPTLWSTYAGLLEARNGLFHPTSFDYIIHALGPENRVAYVRSFERIKPRLVQTVSPKYTQYESWIEDTSWDFYADLLRNYEIVGTTPWSLFWERSDSTRAAPTVVWQSAVNPGDDAVQLPKFQDGSAAPYLLLQVEMAYRTRNALHALPIIGAMPRYLVRASNALQKDPVTLDPYTTTARFPLLVMNGTPAVLGWRAFSLLPGASIDVQAVRISAVPVTERNKTWLTALIYQQGHVMTQ